MPTDPTPQPVTPSAGVAEPELPGPYAVGRYAEFLRERMREVARVRLVGEVTGLRRSRAQAYFELRDPDGGVPCSIWLSDLDRLGLPDGALRDGAEVVVAGGPDYYPGGEQASPSFSFRCVHLRLAGEGDLLARLAELRRRLHAEGLHRPQKLLPRSALPRTIGVVTAEGGAARHDLRAGLDRRGWRGTLIWGFAPVQDRRAAPAVTRAMQDLAALPEVELIVVCRGGGSLADLWAFCDETLCRTVALLRVPVISAVGHETDRTLLDDIAAVSCSTPTHAAEAAVPLDCAACRADLNRFAGALERASRVAVGDRCRQVAALARGPERAVARERRELNQKAREIRAAAERGVRDRMRHQHRTASLVLERARARGRMATRAALDANATALHRLERAAEAALGRHRKALETAGVALRAHDPARTLERGFALVESGGEPLTSAQEAAEARRFAVRFADGRLAARVEEDR